MTSNSKGFCLDDAMFNYLKFVLRQPFAEPPSGLGLAGLGIEQTYPRHLPRVHQVPMNANPNHKEFCSRLGRESKVFWMSDRQCLAVGEMQLEGAEWSSIAHFLKVHDFHIRGLIVNQFIQVFK